MNEKLLTLGEARAVLQVSRATLWRWQSEHGLKVVRIGGVIRVRESDLQAFLKRHETAISMEVSERAVPKK